MLFPNLFFAGPDLPPNREVRSVRDIRIAAAQFEARDRDKLYNLARIEDLAHRAVEQGAEIISFHECCVTGYTFLQTVSREESHAMGDDVVVGLCTAEKMEVAGGRRYLRARRPDLYAKLAEPLPPGRQPVTTPGWR
jgi:hypothetical protein